LCADRWSLPRQILGLINHSKKLLQPLRQISNFVSFEPDIVSLRLIDVLMPEAWRLQGRIRAGTS